MRHLIILSLASKSGHFLRTGSAHSGPRFAKARPGLNTDYTCTFRNDIRIIEFYDNAQIVIQSRKILTFKMIMIIIKTYKSKREVM